MRSYHVIALLILISMPLQAQQAPLNVTFEQIATNQIPTGTFVAIRGFLYKNEKNGWVLLATPNVKSCCLDNQKVKIDVEGNFTDLAMPGIAVLIEGTLTSTLAKITLANAKIIKEEHSDFTLPLLAGLTLLAGFVFWKKRKARS